MTLYENAISDVFKSISLKQKRDIGIASMDDIPKPMATVVTDLYSNEMKTLFHDMEGGTYERNKFSFEQARILDEAYQEGHNFPFLCYPDIPSDIMNVLYLFAIKHLDIKYRIPLWKLSRSGINNPKALNAMCALLEQDICVPDFIVLDDTWIEKFSNADNNASATLALKIELDQLLENA